MEDETAEAAYKIFADALDSKSDFGQPMTPWEGLDPETRQAWRTAADYCYREGYWAGERGL